jgi:hypothetical protein
VKTFRHTMLCGLMFALIALWTRADQVDNAYRDFIAGRYGPVFRNLLAYRLEHEGTLRVDFMLGVSACRLASDNHRAFGGFLLAAIPDWYKPLKPAHMADIQAQSRACPPTGITETEAMAGVSGSSDAPTPGHLVERRSHSGQDQELPKPKEQEPPKPSGPPVVVLPPPVVALPPAAHRAKGMGPLMTGQGFLGGTDYRSAQAASPDECSSLCASEDVCVAMTFIISSKTCYLKNKLTSTAATSDMVSAVKR